MTPLTTKAAEIRAGLEGVVERHAAATPATMDCRAWHDIGLLLALIEQQAAELAAKERARTPQEVRELFDGMLADFGRERTKRKAAESERDELLREKERLGAGLLDKALAVLGRCHTVLFNMARENEGAIFNRWPIHHEPLRSDARSLLPLIDEVLGDD